MRPGLVELSCAAQDRFVWQEFEGTNDVVPQALADSLEHLEGLTGKVCAGGSLQPNEVIEEHTTMQGITAVLCHNWL